MYVCGSKKQPSPTLKVCFLGQQVSGPSDSLGSSNGLFFYYSSRFMHLAQRENDSSSLPPAARLCGGGGGCEAGGGGFDEPAAASSRCAAAVAAAFAPLARVFTNCFDSFDAPTPMRGRFYFSPAAIRLHGVPAAS